MKFFIPLLLLTVSAFAEPNTLSIYRTPPDYPTDNSVRMAVNEQNVPVVKWTTGKKNAVEYLYTRFAFSGTASVKITWNRAIETFDVQPRDFGIQPHVVGSEMTFTLPASRYFIVTINHTKLMVLADPPEQKVPQPGDPRTLSLPPTADPTGRKNCTAALQKIIDTLSTNKGGIAYIPCGTYLVSSFHLKSNVTLYLTDGAALKFDVAAASKDYSKVIHHDQETAHSGEYFIKADNAQNIGIAGRGMIDLNGGNRFDTNGWLASTMRMQNIQNLTVEGVTIRENSSWSVLTAGCQGVRFQNVKVLNGMGFEQNDAFDIISCQDVSIDHCFAYARDDAYCLKAGGPGTHGGGITTPAAKIFGKISVQDCVAYTRDGSGFKMGNQSSVSGNDFVCRDLYTIAGRNAVFLALFDGPAVFGNIRISNIFIDQKNIIPFKIVIKKGGQVKDISVTNVQREGQPVPIRIAPEMQARQ